jgi:CheY-like chemotaxis protein
LKRDPLTESIPVIVLSGLSQKNEQKLKRAGAAAYLEKSILSLEKRGGGLVQAVETLIGKPTSKEGNSPQPAGAEVAT